MGLGRGSSLHARGGHVALRIRSLDDLAADANSVAGSNGHPGMAGQAVPGAAHVLRHAEAASDSSTTVGRTSTPRLSYSARSSIEDTLSAASTAASRREALT
eukprot:10481298-Heterocapsa_arctica.AAC.1